MAPADDTRSINDTVLVVHNSQVLCTHLNVAGQAEETDLENPEPVHDQHC